jgi:hypothetical protein
MDAKWHFFETSHGKGAYDSIGRTIKTPLTSSLSTVPVENSSRYKKNTCIDLPKKSSERSVFRSNYAQHHTLSTLAKMKNIKWKALEDL